MLRFAAALVLLGSLMSACTGDQAAGGVDIAWSEEPLPPHPGAAGQSVVRDAVECGGRWYVVGAVFLDNPSETRDTRPAAWSSTGKQGWRPVEIDADTYWGRRAILNSVACSRGRVATVGARSGGAHGNPRVTTFHLDAGGTLVDAEALFTQFGGVSATNVGPISGGDEGWLIAGNRLSGPGVWVTDDPRAFTKVEEEPGLTDDGELESLAQASAWDGESWVLVGAGASPGQMLDRDPLAWTSPDGLTWTREEMPSNSESEDVHRVIGVKDGQVLAVGLSGDTFAAWERREAGWSRAATFGSVAEDLAGAPYFASLAETAVGILATVSDGATYALWHSRDGGSCGTVETPLTPGVAGNHTLVVGTGDDLLLLADAGAGGRVWRGEPASEG